MQKEAFSKQPYKAELFFSPNRAQTTNRLQEFVSENVVHDQSASELGQGVGKNIESKMESSAPVYKSERSFYPKHIHDKEIQQVFKECSDPKASSKQHILTLESKEHPRMASQKGAVIADFRIIQPQRITNTEIRTLEAHNEPSEEKDAEPTTKGSVSKEQKVQQQSEIKVMPDTPRFEATLSPTSKKLLAVSYTGWGISTDKGFDWLLEQGYDHDAGLVLQRFPIQDYQDRQQQEKEIRKAHIQNKIAEAMFRDPNNNFMIKEAIEDPVATLDENQNAKRPAKEESNTNSQLKTEESLNPVTPLNGLKSSLEVFGEHKVLSTLENSNNIKKDFSHHKAETKFCAPKRVATKIEAKKVLQKKLNKAMKNVIKSEEKARSKKTVKVENVLAKHSDQRKSAKYELMWEDIKKTNQELYQSTPKSSGNPDDNLKESKKEDDVYAKDKTESYEEVLPNEGKMNTEVAKRDTKLERSKENVPAPSSRKHKSETNLTLKRSELKRLSKPNQGPRKSLKNEDFSRGVYKSEAYMVPRQQGKKIVELEQELHEHQRNSKELETHQSKLQTSFHVGKKQDNLKGSSKIYKISVTTVQKSKVVDKKGKFHPAKKDNLFSYKLNTCYKLPITHRHNQRHDDSSQKETTSEKVKAQPKWTTTISFEQYKE